MVMSCYWTFQMCVSIMRIWHWKSHWKLQPRWKTTNKTLKSFTKDNHSDIFSFDRTEICLLLLSKNVNPYNPTEIFQHYSYPLFSQFSALLCMVFQCDFQCHILVVTLHHNLCKHYVRIFRTIFINCPAAGCSRWQNTFTWANLDYILNNFYSEPPIPTALQKNKCLYI